MKRVKKRTPTGKTIIYKIREKPRISKCVNCGKPLHGIPRLHPSEKRKLSKSEKRPSRKYGGYLCGECVREIFREKARLG